ncbi:hypothetical protein FB446DRAFT_304300 [Lentinula raphanica]|nr:hypothetical protein FB446DRAFT_304300 [Lentinula raphanica]
MDGVSRPNTRLVGQMREGYGLSWNPNKAGHILGASEDMTVCHWSILITTFCFRSLKGFLYLTGIVKPTARKTPRSNRRQCSEDIPR